MAAVHRPERHRSESPRTTPVADAVEEHPGTLAHRVLAITRIAFGFTFLWAFLDKTFALGFATGRAEDDTVDRFGDAAWVNGGSPTEGFLGFAADGPFQDFYNDIAGDAWADWLFMLGLLGVGVALTLGAGMRIAAAAGALMYVLMWTVVLPPENNPVIDDHILGALVVVVLAMFAAGDTWGLGRWWGRTGLVRKYPVLK
jgi:thiosulfate dehydrogenase [quinone] large subunit